MDADVAAWSAHDRLHDASPGDVVQVAERALRDAGVKVTRSRRAVLAVLAAYADHVSADQVARVLDERTPPVHRATVYRTLELFADLGIVSPMRVVSGATVYHLATTTQERGHLHARCRRCGRVVGIPHDALGEAVRVAATAGFRLEPTLSTLVGWCGTCTEDGGKAQARVDTTT